MELRLFCIVDVKPIPHERAIRGSNTCSEECRKKRDAMKRAQVDKRRCRHCLKPSTPEERAAFQKWRKAQPDYVPKKKGRPAGASETTVKQLRDLLLLVSYSVPLDVIKQWSPNDRAQAEKYAVKAHLNASDNLVRVPPIPQFLKGFECRYENKSGTVMDLVPQ